MWKFFLLFVLSAPTIAGVLVLVALLTPALQADLGHWIAIAAAVGAILAIPFSLVVSKLGPFQSMA